MNFENLYINKTLTKNGLEIPVVKSGKTIESKYNPEREADTLVNSINEEYGFFVVLGAGGGFFLSKLIQKFPKSKIICIENTDKDILFLQQFPLIKKLSENSSIIFSDICTLQENLIKNYLPGLYGNLKICENRAWMNENSQYIDLIKNEINSALKLISADYSVQVHFGKIWQKNILNNLKLLNNSFSISTNKKKCVIIAAGPSLDSQISYLKNNIDNLFIISTDTGFSTLLKNNIIPEIVISLDGQFISHSHFMHKNIPEQIIFVFDLCSNTSAIKFLSKNKILFFTSGHPLSNMVNNFASNSLLKLNSGAGTVTITALDLANKLNFKEIEVFGADFSYINGKTYAKGTYLDNIYNCSSTKLQTNEYFFSKLQYRTELLTISSNVKTTEVLNSYKKSFETYLSEYHFNFYKDNNRYIITTQNKPSDISFNYNVNFNTKSFFSYIKKEYANNNILFLLPFISFLRNKNKKLNFDELLKLAYSYFVSYN